jgi:hypothetical protein
MRLHFICETSAWSAGDFLLVSRRTRASRRALGAVTELADVDLQFIHGAAECVAVHPKLARSAALIAIVLLKDSRDEPTLEFADCFRIKNITAIHLLYERFKLIFHWVLFSLVFAKVSSLDVVVTYSESALMLALSVNNPGP